MVECLFMNLVILGLNPIAVTKTFPQPSCDGKRLQIFSTFRLKRGGLLYEKYEQ